MSNSFVFFLYREYAGQKKLDNVNFTYTHMQLNNTWQLQDRPPVPAQV